MTNEELIKQMSTDELVVLIARIEIGDVDMSKTFCDLCESCDRELCIRDWLRWDTDSSPWGYRKTFGRLDAERKGE